MIAIECGLGGVVLNPAVNALEDVAVGGRDCATQWVWGCGLLRWGACTTAAEGGTLAALLIAAGLDFLLSRIGLLLALSGLGLRCFCLEFSFGITDPLQPTGSPLQFLWQLIAAIALVVLAVPLGIDDLDPTQQITHLSLQLPLGLEHPLMTHRLVLAGLRSQFGAIQCHSLQAHQTCFLAEAQHLNEQSSKGIQVTALEVADPAVIWLLISGQPPGIRRLPRRLSRSSWSWAAQRSKRTGAVPSSFLGHTSSHPAGPSPGESVGSLQIQLSDKIGQEEDQRVFRQPIHRR